ncbi:MAG: hypothetical protein ACK5MY_15530 [Jhaorihella sp.]
MNNQLARALALGGALAALTTQNALAEDTDAQDLARAGQDSAGFSWEGEIEIGYESVFDSNVPGNETDTAYGRGEFNAAYSFGNGVAVFGGLTFEEVQDALGATGYGFYVHELGVELGFANTTFRLGKVHPAFGTAWDEAAGFYGGTLAEDYELAEQIGVLADVDLGDAGVLSFGTFFADNTALSQSAGFNRGRNTTASGGAGNTGNLDNLSLQWANEFGNTRVWAGARYLSAGVGDVSDETGGFLALGHTFGESFGLFAEVAAFDGYRGTTDNATYATLNGVYYIGNWSLSGTYARRDITSAGVTDLVSVAAEYEFRNGITLGGALAHVDDAGTRDKLFGFNVVIPLGG